MLVGIGLQMARSFLKSGNLDLKISRKIFFVYFTVIIHAKAIKDEEKLEKVNII